MFKLLNLLVSSKCRKLIIVDKQTANYRSSTVFTLVSKAPPPLLGDFGSISLNQPLPNTTLSIVLADLIEIMF